MIKIVDMGYKLGWVYTTVDYNTVGATEQIWRKKITRKLIIRKLINFLLRLEIASATGKQLNIIYPYTQQ